MNGRRVFVSEWTLVLSSEALQRVAFDKCLLAVFHGLRNVLRVDAGGSKKLFRFAGGGHAAYPEPRERLVMLERVSGAVLVVFLALHWYELRHHAGHLHTRLSADLYRFELQFLNFL